MTRMTATQALESVWKTRLIENEPDDYPYTNRGSVRPQDCATLDTGLPASTDRRLDMLYPELHTADLEEVICTLSTWLQETARLLASGWTPAAIGVHLGYSRQGVHSKMAQIREELSPKGRERLQGQ